MATAIATALAALQTQAMAAALNGGFIRIFTGPRPAAPELAETGTLLGTLSVNAVANAGLHFLASGASLSKANEQWAFIAQASGTATWFRLVQPGDTGADDPDALRLDGDIGTATDPGDMTWQDTAVLTGLPYRLDSFVYLIQPIG